MKVFNPDQFFKRRTIFSSENFGPGDWRSGGLEIRGTKISRTKIPVTAPSM